MSQPSSGKLPKFSNFLIVVQLIFCIRWFVNQLHNNQKMIKLGYFSIAWSQHVLLYFRVALLRGQKDLGPAAGSAVCHAAGGRLPLGAPQERLRAAGMVARWLWTD